MEIEVKQNDNMRKKELHPFTRRYTILFLRLTLSYFSIFSYGVFCIFSYLCYVSHTIINNSFGFLEFVKLSIKIEIASNKQPNHKFFCIVVFNIAPKKKINFNNNRSQKSNLKQFKQNLSQMCIILCIMHMRVTEFD